MNILFAIGDLRIGGVARVQSVITNELQKKGWDINLFSFRETPSYYPLIKEVTFADKAINNWRFYRLLMKTAIEKYLLKKTVDMIVRPNHHHLESLVKHIRENEYEKVVLVEQWIIYAEKLRETFPEIKFIAWLHMDVSDYETRYLSKSSSEFLRGLNFCDDIIVLTGSENEGLKKRGFKNSRVIANPLTIKESSEVANLDTKTISFVGRLVYMHKGLDYLVEIAKILPSGWKIELAGEGRDREKLKKDIKKNNISDRLILKGKLDGESLAEHYLNSSIFIMTSKFESFGLVIVEAMNFGLPIIAFSQTGSEEVLDKGEYGILVPNGDVAEFSKELTKMISDKELREFYSQQSLKRVKDFELATIVEKWEGFLKE